MANLIALFGSHIIVNIGDKSKQHHTMRYKFSQVLKIGV
jgi:uncharacterized protein Veg